MNFLGIGPAEVLVIFVIMLVVAGPKRMVQWAYQIGRYTSQIRKMFQEAMDAFNKELNDAGIDLKDLAKDIPTVPSIGAFNILEEADKVINSTPDYAAQQAASATPPPEPEIGPEPKPVSSTPPEPPAATTDEKTDNEGTKYDSWLPK